MTRPPILLVEDNEDDVFVMKLALTKCGVINPLHVVTDGQMAVDYLSGTAGYADRAKFPLPFIVFLDLKLPYIHGFEVLAWIKQQPALSSMAVTVLTSSDESRDSEKAYALGARSYLVKPPTPASLRSVFDALTSLWLSRGNNSPVMFITTPSG